MFDISFDKTINIVTIVKSIATMINSRPLPSKDIINPPSNAAKGVSPIEPMFITLLTLAIISLEIYSWIAILAGIFKFIMAIPFKRLFEIPR